MQTTFRTNSGCNHSSSNHETPSKGKHSDPNLKQLIIDPIRFLVSSELILENAVIFDDIMHEKSGKV
jgi:hypothetical protein